MSQRKLNRDLDRAVDLCLRVSQGHVLRSEELLVLQSLQPKVNTLAELVGPKQSELPVEEVAKRVAYEGHALEEGQLLRLRKAAVKQAGSMGTTMLKSHLAATAQFSAEVADAAAHRVLELGHVLTAAEMKVLREAAPAAAAAAAAAADEARALRVRRQPTAALLRMQSSARR